MLKKLWKLAFFFELDDEINLSSYWHKFWPFKPNFLINSYISQIFIKIGYHDGFSGQNWSKFVFFWGQNFGISGQNDSVFMPKNNVYSCLVFEQDGRRFTGLLSTETQRLLCTTIQRFSLLFVEQRVAFVERRQQFALVLSSFSSVRWPSRQCSRSLFTAEIWRFIFRIVKLGK